MTPDASPRSGLEPAASLTSVRVKRRQRPIAPSGKRGDLTAGGEARAASEDAAPSVIVLPPPALPELPAPVPLVQELLLDERPLELPEPAPPATELLLEERPREPIEPEPLAEALLLAEQPPEPIEPERIEAEPVEAEPVELEASEPEPDRPAPAFLRLTPTPVPEPPQRVAPPAPAEAAADEDLLDHWDSLRGARDVPALDALDRAAVAARWPNTVLVAVEPTELHRITRLGENDGEIEYTATVIDWIMGRSRASAKRGEPMEEEQRFAVAGGGARYRLLLLPLGGDAASCRHVLCQLSRLEELSAVQSFRRWLTG